MTGVAGPALNALPNFIQADLTGSVLPAVPAHSPPHGQDVRLGHQPMGREYPISQKTDAVPHGINPAFVAMQAEPQRAEIVLNF
jgi:hypothetical protein